MKTALITGASGNLGQACVNKFLKEGYHVVATVTPGKGLGYSVDGPVETVDLDLTNESRVTEVIKSIISKRGSLDAALLLVGGYASGGIAETDGATLQRMIALNFETAYFVARPVFQQMISQASGGRIIFIGARPALRPKEANKSLGYALSKSLIFKLAEALSAAGSSSNVTTSVVVPSTIDTPSNRTAMPKADFSAWVGADEIAAALFHLCSDQAAAWKNNIIKIYGRS
jgi:NAD(P)-dependent dehydrogenase (short-subunit alcohol dehydrogenase family)